MDVPVAVAGWGNHANTFMSLIDSYKRKELFCDCTLACDRKFFRAHKIILAMSSELFENIFLTTEDKNPVIILHEIEAWQIECLLNYMYKGETRVADSHFISLCRVAKSLQIKGFDKVELYREAVKQSGKKDSRLITRTDESRNENFFSLRNQEEFSGVNIKKCDQDELQWNKHLNGLKNARLQDGGGFPCLQNVSSSHYSHSRCQTSSPTQCHHQTDYSLPPGKEMPPKAQSPTEDHSKLEESPPSSFTGRCNYQSSRTLNFKKNHLLSSPMVAAPPPDFQKPNHSPQEDVSQNRSSPGEDSTTYLPTNIECVSESQQNQQREMGTVMSDAKPIARPKQLREPPPLLRVTYSSSPEESRCKPGNESNQTSNEILDSYRYDPIHPYPSQQQFLDNCLHVTLNSQPGSDPLLQKIPTNKRKRVRGPKSWEFLLRLLRSPESNPSLIRWENEEAGIFRLIRPEVIALRWGRRTGKHVHDILSYESFSRGLRYHYATGALCAVSEKSFVYQFGPKAQNAMHGSKSIKQDTMPILFPKQEEGR